MAIDEKMEESVKKVLRSAEEGMQKAIDHLENDLLKIRAGKANPAILETIKVDYYGTMTALNFVATLSAPDAKTLVIQPFEKKMIPIIEKAIVDSNLGFTPQNDGSVIRINVPPLTEERRKSLVKQVKEICEEARVAVRNIRRDNNEQLKKLQKNGVAQDIIKAAENDVQKLTDKHIKVIDDLFDAKEAEIMKV